MTNVIMYVSLYNDDDSDRIKQNSSSSEWQKSMMLFSEHMQNSMT